MKAILMNSSPCHNKRSLPNISRSTGWRLPVIDTPCH
uniref:Uncharacterized protein n=1 Tax=Tetranychus urticae TaxID=32264 RepID=T1KQQ9_TETUR